jgi:hypothetical protein
MPPTAAQADRFFDTTAVAEAAHVTDLALEYFLDGAACPRGTVVSAPAGAGKTFLVSTAVGRARDRELRVGVAAPTNEQAFGLVRRIAEIHCRRKPGEMVTFVPASDVRLPDDVRALPWVREARSVRANRKNLVVGTLDKLGDAFSRGDLQPFDVLLIDESYQADSSRYFAAAALAPVHLLVGDAGQISPFTTIEDPCRWRGLPEDPLQTAVGVLCRNHPTTRVFGLPITRRLDGRAVQVAQLFYPNLRFRAAVRPGVREFRLPGPLSLNPLLRKLDRALAMAAREGWAHLQLPRALVLQADPRTVELIAALVARLFERGPSLCCERSLRPAELPPERVAVGVAHNDQKEFLRAALAGRGLGGVVVETANKLQGLEYEVVIVWHPLAGLADPDGFHLDPGRLCVLLTRHRHACFVVGRVGDREMIDQQLPPSTPAYLGYDQDPVLDGWEVHRQVYTALEPFSVTV